MQDRVGTTSVCDSPKPLIFPPPCERDFLLPASYYTVFMPQKVFYRVRHANNLCNQTISVSTIMLQLSLAAFFQRMKEAKYCHTPDRNATSALYTALAGETVSAVVDSKCRLTARLSSSLDNLPIGLLGHEFRPSCFRVVTPPIRCLPSYSRTTCFLISVSWKMAYGSSSPVVEEILTTRTYIIVSTTDRVGDSTQ